MIIFNNGLGETLGDTLVTTKPVQTPGNIWFVNSATGTDAASPAGKDRQKPLATLGQAQTNAADGDIVVLQSGHTETYTVALTLSKRLIIVGGGSSAGKPTVSFINNSAGASTFTISVTNVELRNIYFPASLQSNASNGKVNVAAANCRITGCYFEQSALDQSPAVRLLGADTFRMTNTTIISTATTTATRPTVGLSNAGAIADLELYGCVFSDGTVGFSTAAADLSAFAVTRIRAESMSLLNGADFLMNSGSTGYVNVATSTNGGRLSW